MDARSELETIGERILRLRRERGLSQRALASKGIGYAYISRIERGDRVPSMKALRALAGKLGVTVAYLETGSDLSDAETRELRLGEAELALRLDGDVTATEDALREVLAEAIAAGDRRDAARAKIGLALAAEHRGEHERAVELLEQAVGEPWVTPLTHPNAFATLGHAYICSARGERAVALFEDIVAELAKQTPVETTALTRFATYLSYARSDVGDLDGARAAIQQALAYSSSSDDAYTRVRLFWSNARLASLSGDGDLALLSINRAIALLEATEDTTHLARAHLVAAEIATADGALDLARDHLESADELVGAGNSRQDRAWLRVQQALVEARGGDPAAALDRATEAIGLLRDDDDRTLRGCGHWALAEAYAAVGAAAAARSGFEQAAELIEPGSKYADGFLKAWMRLYPADATLRSSGG